MDDSLNYALSDDSDFWDGPNSNDIDLYMFAHGLDYKGALNDYIRVGGSIAMVPRNAMGVWWTRWYDFNQQTALDSVDDFRTRSIPLDILVLDMNWHLKNDWTGYTFDTRLYPQVEDLFDQLHYEGLLTAGNIHDADGVMNFEAQFEQMCTTLGYDPVTTTVVPYNISDYPSQMALEDDVMLPLEETTFDFWWIDWQQGESGYGAEGGKMNPTIWTSHVRSTNKQRRGSDERGMVLSRWGGLGGHRYQVGFSGDVQVRWNDKNWEDLSYQPYFSATASNVGFGYWSHDIVGPPLDMELYVRWLQWGAFSSVMRNHDRGMSAGQLCSDTDPSVCAVVSEEKKMTTDRKNLVIFYVHIHTHTHTRHAHTHTNLHVSSEGATMDAGNDNFVAMRNALRARGALLPYLYTSVRESYDFGIGVMRPMYYEFPDEFPAYLQSRSLPQYFLGDTMVVSPIVTPSDSDTKLADQLLWIPPGNWMERTTGLLRTGSSSVVGVDDENKRKLILKPSTTTCASPTTTNKVYDCASNGFYNQEQCERKGCCWNDLTNGGNHQNRTDVKFPTCFYSNEIMSQLITKYADLDETPILIKSGSILIEFPDSVNGGYQPVGGGVSDLIGRASRSYDCLSLSIFLSGSYNNEKGREGGGLGGGSTVLYEDDGQTIAYVNGSFMTTSMSWSLSNTSTSSSTSTSTSTGNLLTLNVEAASGNGFADMPVSRDYEVRIVNSPPPMQVTLTSTSNMKQTLKSLKARPGYMKKDKFKKRRNDNKINDNNNDDNGSWYYDGTTTTLIISITDQSTTSPFSISCQFSQPSSQHEKNYFKHYALLNKISRTTTSSSSLYLSQDILLSGVRGVLRRSLMAKEILNEARLCPGETTGEQNEGALQLLSSTSSILTNNAMNLNYDMFWNTISNIPNSLYDAMNEIDTLLVNQTKIGEWRVVQARAYLEA
eukprot:CAMPEP_0114363576 /NCGR_PEP_ID=MMETSP0101-20121206/26710_1 /TAXON_ID=38822 ORGANISM="Pteridomonas danica, Strain PT" /NCGR_SAMPLE_ID=MMETSP0101 /ASSEMBLY_ACC=CAM_ASM_000211 /LENGTH=940 /DNA_ID=CAMNT_0001510367 /DNA_START=107 /DNA_END=2927 /DNA_ORIENTATION=+